VIDWLDYKSIKRGVSFQTVLDYYRIQLQRSGEEQFRGCCPIHRGKGRDAFHVNTSRNLFHCFSCEAGGTVLDFVAAMERCSLYEAARKLESIACSFSAPTATASERELVTKERNVCLPLKFALTPIDATHPYLAARGISKKTATEFGVGFYSGPGLMHGRLVIPIHNAAGELVAYSGRTVDQKLPRYQVPSGFRKSEVLFNMHRAGAAGGASAVMVEGFFDCMKVHQAGIPSVVAIMGSVLYEPQCCALLSHFRHIVLMLDGDAAGRRATQVIAAKLGRSCQVVALPTDVQPDQLSAKEIRKILLPRLQRRLPAG
jgi:DNA primase